MVSLIEFQGQVENDLIACAKEHAEDFESYIMRPAFVLSETTNVKELVFSLGPSVKVDVLAKTMLDIAVNGSERQIWENADIKARQ